MMKLSSNALTNIIALIALGVSLFAYFSISSDQKDFNGMRPLASVRDGKVIVSVPKSYVANPISVFVLGSAVNNKARAEPPYNFRLQVAFLTHEFDDNTRNIVYEDIRPLVCRELRDLGDCDDFNIQAVSIEAEFPRGNREINVYQADEIPLG